MVFRNISCSAQLHAISFLSQINLHDTDSSLAASLLNIYIGLFRILISAKEMNNKVLNALLFATNRAFPYAKGVGTFFFFLEAYDSAYS